MYYSKVADKVSWNFPTRTVDGMTMALVGIKTSRRRLRRGKTEYNYHMVGTKAIYYNNSKNGVLFVPMARKESDMKKYYDLYCVKPLTVKEQEYLDMHPHIKLVV